MKEIMMIMATEFGVEAANGPPSGMTFDGSPALFGIEARQLVQICRIHRGVIPGLSIKDPLKESWMVWDEDLGKWTFNDSYWASRLRMWRPVRFQVVSAIDHRDNVFLTSVPEVGAINMMSISLDVLALQGLAQMALNKHKHVMAAQRGFRLFTDFEAFEPMFLDALEPL